MILLHAALKGRNKLSKGSEETSPLLLSPDGSENPAEDLRAGFAAELQRTAGPRFLTGRM